MFLHNDEYVVGVDLGTTNTCAAIMTSTTHLPQVVSYPNNLHVFKSCVRYGTQIDVGEAAYNCLINNCPDVVKNSKRIIGRYYDDEIVVNGTLLNSKEDKEYYLLYKPEGVITSVKDEKMRQTVVDLVDTTARIYPVGRLDYNTTGLLLLTNDGELANILMHPSHQVEKLYLAKINGILTPGEFMRLKKGIVIDGRKVVPSYLKVKKENRESNTSSILIGITEGRNHIVKRIFEHFSYKVIHLKRETYAFLDLQGLKPGEYRRLSIKEIKKLYALK